MNTREYDDVMLIMGVLSVKGFPASLKAELEESFGPIEEITEPFPFSFTDYYVPEMGDGIMRFFIRFQRLIKPDELAAIKSKTIEIEKKYSEEGGRKINLDPGTLSDSNLILATTKNRSHRIAIGDSLYGELTLIYQNHDFQSFPWTYADYKSDKVRGILISFRKELLHMRRENSQKQK